MLIHGIELHVEETGTGPPIVFSHGLLMSGRMYSAQVAALRNRYRCIVYDHRGQGRSGTPSESTIDVDTVYEDAAALIEALNARPCHFVGLSMGGFVGLRLAARRPEPLRSLVLISTESGAQPEASLPGYRRLNLILRLGGARWIARSVLQIMYGETFLNDPARAADRREALGQLGKVPRRVHRAVSGVLRRESVEGELSSIHVPALVIHGEEDLTLPIHKGRQLHAGIENSWMVTIERGGHTLTIETPEAVNEALAGFLDRQEADPT